ncbi:MAG: M28 family peptidase [Bacteroidota bacterium]|nr:M28 family peptidase [Bacteroidota bacterium]
MKERYFQWINIVQSIITTLFVFISLVGYGQEKSGISAEKLKNEVSFLASDSLKGRKPGTKEANAAASFIHDRFQSAGLRFICDSGYQYFEIVTDVSLGQNNSLSFLNFHGTVTKDYTPLAFSTPGEVNAPVVFAGYGFDIDLDSLKWKDYENIDVKGKWTMIFSGDPEMDNNESRFIPFSELRGKILTAKDHGAAGVLVVSPKGYEKSDKLLGLHSENNDVTSGIPVLNLKRSVADSLLMISHYSVDSLETLLNSRRKPFSFETNVKLYSVNEVIMKKALTANVVGVLEGNDPLLKNEYIVVGGHYDHLGFGGPGSGSRMPDTLAIHNGADDNASGTAMVMELAGKLASEKQELRRSLLFISFSGEEMGLLGSKYFMEHCPVPVSHIKAMFNFDMVGRFNKEKNAISISGTGTSAESDSILRKYETGLPFQVTHSAEGYGPSDHASFYASNIPVFFFTTGVHTDYHTPFDKADKLDYEAEKIIGDFSARVILDIDRMNHPLSFRESGKKESIGRGGRRLKVTLGIMPDFAGTEKKGLRVDGVTKNGPADKGGILKGDIIISLNGMSVGNIYEYMSRLGKLKPGQIISVEVLRNESHEVLIIQL